MRPHGIIAIHVALAAAVIGEASAMAAECAPVATEETTADVVIDERTLTLADGRTVRLSGLVAMADAIAPSALVGRLAREAREMLARLVADRTVTLRTDGSGAAADRHGRIAGQLFATDGEREIWLQEALVEAGLARVTPFRSRPCSGPLLAREAEARRAGRGLWAERAYAVRRADPPGPLYRLAGTFQIVEGTVVAVASTAYRTYLNFAEDWRRDFTVAVPAGDLEAFAGTPADPALLEGRRIRVRGWIELGGGPLIVATAPEEIEVEKDPAAAP